MTITVLRNPPYPPFFIGGDLSAWLVKSPFEKGGFRGIFFLGFEAYFLLTNN
jgi:hypothetical protein